MDEFYQDLLEPVVYRWVKTHEHIKVCENQCTLCIDGSNSTGIISFHNEGIVELSVKNKDSDEILFYLHFQMHDFKSTMDQFNTFFNYLCLPTIKLGESIFNNVNTNKILLSCSGGLTTSYFAYSMQEIFKRQGLDIVVDDDGKEYYIDFVDLEMKLADPQTTMMILCNPHNPIGKIWDIESLERIGEMCAKYNVLVISDEIHCDLTAPNKNYIPFASVSKVNQMNSITCIAPTKAFNLAGLQTACIVVANPQLRHKVNRGINTDEVAEPNSFAITATVAAFTKGAVWLDELREYIEENKNIVSKFIRCYLPEIYLIPSEATYLLWLDCSRITTDSTMLTQFIRDKTGLYLTSGIEYGENGNGFIRMNIACPQSRLFDGLERFKEGIRAYQQGEIKMEEIDIEKMHQFEDVINMEIFYNKTTQEIMEQYYLQRENADSLAMQDFTLTDEELRVLDQLIKI